MTQPRAGGRARLALLLPNLGGGGAERVALALMESFVAAGHDVDLLLLRREGALLPLVPAGVRIVDLGAPRILKSIAPIVRYLREARPNAIQVSMWPLTVAAIVAHRLARSSARMVISDHVALSKQYAASPRTTAALRLTTRLFYPKAAGRVAVSAAVAEDLALLSGLPAGDFEVIHNPIPAPAADGGAGAAEWPAGGSRILAAGRLTEQKNHALLLRAFARLREERPASLVILGEGALRAPLAALAETLGIARDVAMPGFVLDTAPYYASADLFVLSSDYEGFGNVLVEAMRFGVPVVSTDCPAGPREVLAGGALGPLTPVGDTEALAEAMARTLDSPPDPARLRERAETLSGSDSAKRYLELMLGTARS